MDTADAAAAFAALSQPTRLDAFRLLADAGPSGMPAGLVAERLGVVASTLSHHLGQLERAGLVRTRRDGRFIYYAADPDGVQRLQTFVNEACGPASRNAAPGLVRVR